MELKRLYEHDQIDVCPHCGSDEITCPECNRLFGYCFNCGESFDIPEVFLVFTTDKYNGSDSLAQDTVTLIIDGYSYAYAHIEKAESDAGADVAYLQLGFIQAAKQNVQMAKIISDFAKWIRYDWKTMDKQSVLPTLVRLIGFYTHKDSYQLEQFIALWDATRITAEHLSFDFTSKEVTA